MRLLRWIKSFKQRKSRFSVCARCGYIFKKDLSYCDICTGRDHNDVVQSILETPSVHWIGESGIFLFKNAFNRITLLEEALRNASKDFDVLS